MNADVNSEKEKVKESQRQSKRGTLAQHTLRVPGRGRHTNPSQNYDGFLSLIHHNFVTDFYY